MRRTPVVFPFHSNGTTALNAAIHGLLRAGDHVVASAAEHNSVLRPLHDLREQQENPIDDCASGSAGGR